MIMLRVALLSFLSTEKPYACAARQSFVSALGIFMSYIKLKSSNHDLQAGGIENVSMF